MATTITLSQSLKTFARSDASALDTASKKVADAKSSAEKSLCILLARRLPALEKFAATLEGDYDANLKRARKAYTAEVKDARDVKSAHGFSSTCSQVFRVCMASKATRKAWASGVYTVSLTKALDRLSAQQPTQKLTVDVLAARVARMVNKMNGGATRRKAILAAARKLVK